MRLRLLSYICLLIAGLVLGLLGSKSFAVASVVAAQAQPNVSSDSIDQLNALSRKMLERLPDSALRYGEQALEAAEEANFKRGMAEAMSNLGFYYLDRAEYTSSYEYFNKVYLIMKDMGDTTGMVDGLRNLGAVYRQRTMYKEAEDYFQEALKLATDINSRSQLATVNKDLGGLNYYIKNYRKALQYFQGSLRYIDKDKERATYAAVLNNIGVVYKAWKQYEKALSYLTKAYEILVEQGNIRDLSANLMNIGEVYDKLGRDAEAEAYFFKALAAAQKVKNIQRLVESYQYLAGFYAKLENYPKAFDYQVLYSQYQDSLYNQNVGARMAEMAKKLDIERKERAFSQLIKDKELEILNKENEIHKLEIFRKNNLILLAILAVVIIGSAAFVLYRSYRDKNNQNTQLNDQNNLLQEMNVKLQNSERKLKELNQTKDKFFGILAHDLRSPLTSLRGFVQVLNLGYNNFEPEEITRLTGQIERSLQSLTSLLDNLLQWATSQTGIIEFAPETLDLYQIAVENQDLLESVAFGKEVALENLVEPGALAYADDQMIRLILRNLVSNSIKFTPPNGQVSVSAFDDEQHTNLVISDTGTGMDAATVKSIRNKNMIGSRRGTENEKGSGLGLVLCHDFIQKHGGRIEVESELGQGTVFTVKFPKKTTEARKPLVNQN